MRWTRWDERYAGLTEDEVAVEWWTVLVLRPRSNDRIYFVERGTAEMYARFLLRMTPRSSSWSTGGTPGASRSS